MEIGSSGGGGGEGGAGGGGEDLHGLKFGKKIYFEDAAAPASGSGGGGAAPSSSKTAAAAGAGGKKGKGAAGGAAAPPPRCQVEGCDVDLTGAKAYYCRHKVCGMHSKAPRVVVAGLEQRFCQQCSRFHQLPEFDQGKRSCRRRLAGHNERRRKPPPGPLSSRYGGLAASFHEEPGRFRSYLLDFSYPRVPSSVRDVWPTVQPGDRMSGGVQWQGNLDLHPHDSSTFAGYGAHVARPPVVPAPELPTGGCLAGVAAAAADSSCALSLLSTPPWGTTTHSAGHSRASVMPAAGSFDGSPVAPSVMASNYMAAPAWTSARGHEASRAVPPQLPHEVALDVVPPGQFSGELELALQGNRLTPPPHVDHGSGSALDSASNTMHWSR